MNRRSLLLTAGAVTLAACASSRTAPAGLSGDLDAAIHRGLARLEVAPGVAVAVYSRDGAYTRGFGVTDVSTGQAVTADTAFYIASSTKPLTSLALAILAGRGELDLDASLSAYAPDAPFPAAVRASEVRLRDLLTHASGIDNGPIGFRVAYTGQHDPETLWRLLAESTSNTDAPLGTFEYTNVGYNIATVLTDRGLGVRWQDLLQREIFGPAGMTHATAIMSRAARENWSLARPHLSTAPGRPQRIALEKTDQTMQSAGGVIMSANDAARWLELMVEDGRVGGRQIVPAAIVQSTRAALVRTGGEVDGYTRESYGLGWHVGGYRGEPLIHHFGGFAGARAHVSYMPRRGVGVAAFVNESAAGSSIVDVIANYVYDRAVGRPGADAAYDEAIAGAVRRRDEIFASVAQGQADRATRPWTLTRPPSAYVGRYSSPAFGTMDLSLDGERIAVTFGALHAVSEPFTRPDSIRVELIPGSGSSIQFEGAGATPTALVSQGARFARV